jgi:predicted regulator of Ras-like GTPase activity (Roadblock/LC7/MglB family)
MAESLDLPTYLLDEVEYHLNNLFDRTGASCVLLVDISGQLISFKGNVQGVDLASLAALVAGDMAAVSEMARILGEGDQFKLLIHEGEPYNILISAVRGSFQLAIIFKTTVQIGLVRLFTKGTVTKLSNLVVPREGIRSGASQIVDADFTNSLADELERAFNA